MVCFFNLLLLMNKFKIFVWEEVKNFDEHCVNIEKYNGFEYSWDNKAS
jgi:hypothetical protein